MGSSDLITVICEAIEEGLRISTYSNFVSIRPCCSLNQCNSNSQDTVELHIYVTDIM